MTNRITKEEYLEMIGEDYKQKRSCLWYVLYPGQFPANDIRLSEPGTLADAIDYILAWQGTDDMPEGIQFWIG